MKALKKTLVLLLALMLCISCFVACNKENDEPKYSEGLSFKTNGDGTCYVYDMGVCADLDIVIPEKSPEGDTVTAIGDGAFALCVYALRVTLPTTVKTIGEEAFYGCEMLSEIVLSEGLQSIKDRAFYKCTRLKSLSVPASVTEIGKLAFAYCKWMTEIVFSDGLTALKKESFAYCERLKAVTLPASVTEIGDWIFLDSPFERILYQGTMAEWETISKGQQWDSIYDEKHNYTVVCTDGEISVAAEARSSFGLYS